MPDRKWQHLSIAFVMPLMLYGAAGKVTKESLDIDGQTGGYFLFVPKGLSGTSAAPLLVLLHGSNHDGSSLIEPWKKMAENEGIILVAPNAHNPAGWASPVDGPKFVIDVAEAVKKAYAINPRRVYLFGCPAWSRSTLPRRRFTPARSARILRPGYLKRLNA